MAVRKYNEYVPYDRPKIARNKYGLTDLSVIGGSSSSSLFGGSETAGMVVGAEMVDINDFKGATKTEDGVRGLVPAPIAGQNEYFLKGNGSWVDIPAYRWMEEWPRGAGFEKSGLSVKGDLNVDNTLTTMNLKVEGAAHFWELLIDEVKANGGQLIVSPALFHVDFVGELVYVPVFDNASPLYNTLKARRDITKMMNLCHVESVKCRRLYMRNDDGTKQTRNECQVGDMVRCRSFNVKEGVYHNVSNKDYWTFVCDTGEGQYVDTDNNTHSAFYIDVAYSLKLQSPITLPDGRNISSLPLGTKLKSDGTVEVPAGYTEIYNIIGLKSVSQETLNGNPTVQDEYFDQEEFKEITTKVVNIRGIADQINDIVGG